jgi:hypothetical protein
MLVQYVEIELIGPPVFVRLRALDSPCTSSGLERAFAFSIHDVILVVVFLGVAN